MASFGSDGGRAPSHSIWGSRASGLTGRGLGESSDPRIVHLVVRRGELVGREGRGAVAFPEHHRSGLGHEGCEGRITGLLRPEEEGIPDGGGLTGGEQGSGRSKVLDGHSRALAAPSDGVSSGLCAGRGGCILPRPDPSRSPVLFHLRGGGARRGQVLHPNLPPHGLVLESVPVNHAVPSVGKGNQPAVQQPLSLVSGRHVPRSSNDSRGSGAEGEGAKAHGHSGPDREGRIERGGSVAPAQVSRGDPGFERAASGSATLQSEADPRASRRAVNEAPPEPLLDRCADVEKLCGEGFSSLPGHSSWASLPPPVVSKPGKRGAGFGQGGQGGPTRAEMVEEPHHQGRGMAPRLRSKTTNGRNLVLRREFTWLRWHSRKRRTRRSSRRSVEQNSRGQAHYRLRSGRCFKSGSCVPASATTSTRRGAARRVSRRLNGDSPSQLADEIQELGGAHADQGTDRARVAVQSEVQAQLDSDGLQPSRRPKSPRALGVLQISVGCQTLSGLESAPKSRPVCFLLQPSNRSLQFTPGVARLPGRRVHGDLERRTRRELVQPSLLLLGKGDQKDTSRRMWGDLDHARVEDKTLLETPKALTRVSTTIVHRPTAVLLRRGRTPTRTKVGHHRGQGALFSQVRSQLWEKSLGDQEGAATALNLARSSLATTTLSAYGSTFKRFVHYCHWKQRPWESLVVDNNAMAVYAGYLRDRQYSPRSIPKMLSSAFRAAEDNGLPTNKLKRSQHALLSQVMKGLAKEAAQLTQMRVPLPAQFVQDVMKYVDNTIRFTPLTHVSVPWLHQQRAILIQSAFAVVLAFCGFLRRSTVLAFERSDLSEYAHLPTTLRVHLRKEKGKKKTRLIAIRGYVGQWLIKHLSYLDSHHPFEQALHTVHHDIQLLLTQWLTRLKYAPPPGTLYQWHSLRSGGATSAYAAQVPEATIQRFGGWATISTPQKHYIDYNHFASAADRQIMGFLSA